MIAGGEDMTEMEGRSLVTHVAVCRERYRALHGALERGERRMTRIERILWGVVVFLVMVDIPAAKEFVGYLL